MTQMVVVDGVRYRLEDALRLGLVPPPAAKRAEPAPNKARRPANKGRRGDG